MAKYSEMKVEWDMHSFELNMLLKYFLNGIVIVFPRLQCSVIKKSKHTVKLDLEDSNQLS